MWYTVVAKDEEGVRRAVSSHSSKKMQNRAYNLQVKKGANGAEKITTKDMFLGGENMDMNESDYILSAED